MAPANLSGTRENQAERIPSSRCRAKYLNFPRKISFNAYLFHSFRPDRISDLIFMTYGVVERFLLRADDANRAHYTHALSEPFPVQPIQLGIPVETHLFRWLLDACSEEKEEPRLSEPARILSRFVEFLCTHYPYFALRKCKKMRSFTTLGQNHWNRDFRVSSIMNAAPLFSSCWSFT